MLLITFLILLLAAFGFSWFSFLKASNDPTQVYLPLENYFFTNKVDKSSALYARPDFFISDFDFKPVFTDKLVYELFIWLFVLLSIAVFVRLLSSHEWFVTNKRTIEDIPLVAKPFRWISVKLQHRNNIFNLTFQNITLVSICFALVFVFMLPNDSSDLYGYMARGAQQIYYELNPYHHTVSEISNWSDQPLFANINSLWAKNPAPYGPFYMLLYAGIAFLSMGNFYIALFLFKFFNFTIFVLLLLLLVRILNDKEIDKTYLEKKFSDSRQVFSYKKIIYSLIALNPFLHYEALWNAHNDIFMGFLVLLGLYLAFKNHLNMALVVLTISFLAKYISLIVIPFVVIYAFTRPLRDFPWWGSMVSIWLTVATWIYYHPFAVYFSKISGNILLSHKSLQRTISSIYKLFAGEPMPSFVNYILLGIFTWFLFYLYYKFFENKNKKLNIFYFSFLALFTLIFIASAKFHSWYLLMILPLGALIHPRLIIVLSISHLLSLTFLDQANIANFVVMTAIPSVIYFKYLLKQDL